MAAMPRLSLVLLAALTACGSDTVDISTDAPGGIAPVDADDPVVPPGDGDVPDPDALVDASVPLTLCQEATQHSDFAWLQANVFTPSCATAGCHRGTDASVGLRLDVGQAYNNLVNKGSSTQPGWVRVVPGSLGASYLVVSFGRADGPPPRDGFMPLGADALCTEIHEAVERWILAGAPM
jgi:hypothetical protein